MNFLLCLMHGYFSDNDDLQLQRISSMTPPMNNSLYKMYDII